MGKYTRTCFLTLGSCCKACCPDTSLRCPWRVIPCSLVLEAERSKGFLCTCPFRIQQAFVSAQGQTSYRQTERKEEEPWERVCVAVAKMRPVHRACPPPRMIFRSSLAFSIQVWLTARVAQNRMHQYTQESKYNISGRSNFTL